MKSAAATKWDPHFALGGGAALELLDKEHFDIVVSDIEMPIVSGIAVLKHTQATHPDTLRIGLAAPMREDMARTG